MEPFQGLHNPGVEGPSPLLKETAVNHFVREGLLKCIFALGIEPHLVEELRRLEVGEAAMEVRLRQLSNGLHQRQGHLMADDGGDLEEAFVLWRQPVDTRRQHRMYRGRHLNGREGLRQAIGAWLADQYPRLHEGTDALLQEKG